MRRLFLALAALILLRADMYPNAGNADQPEALQNLTNQIVTLSAGGVLKTGAGSTVPVYGTSTPTVWDIAKGTDAAPITTAGQQIRMLYRHGVDKSLCFNNSDDTGCISPLLINAIGSPTSTMVTSAATFFAEARAPIGGSSAQGINALGFVTGAGTGSGTGAYLQGSTYSSGFARAHGAEISTGNYSPSDYCTVSTGGVSTCDGIWLTSRAGTPGWSLSSALHIGSAADGSFWKEGITINSNALVSTGTGYRDLSNATRSIFIQGTHATAAIASANGSGYWGVNTASPTALLHIAGGISAAGVLGINAPLFKQEVFITDTTAAGTIPFSTLNSMAVTLAATNPVTASTATTLYIAPPVAGTNVTISNPVALGVGGAMNVSGMMSVAGAMQLGAGIAMTLAAGELGLAKITTPTATAPGAAQMRLAVTAGTTAGTCKLIAFAGTSTTPTAIIDNVGAGC